MNVPFKSNTKIVMPGISVTKIGIGIGSSGGWSPETKLYLNACGIIDDGTIYFSATAYELSGHQIWTVFEKFIKGIKSDGVWDKLIDFYPLLGVNYTSVKYNLINPVDSDAGFRLVPLTTDMIYSGKGIEFPAGGDTMKTKLILNNYGTNIAVGSYSIDAITQAKYLYGMQLTADERFWLSPNFNGTKMLSDLPGYNNRINVNIPNSAIGLWQFWIESGNLYWQVEGIDQIGMTPAGSFTLPSQEIYLGGYNSNGSLTNYPTAGSLSMWYYGTDFTKENNEDLTVRMNQLMVDLKRIAL
jgi:hypothetical protein